MRWEFGRAVFHDSFDDLLFFYSEARDGKYADYFSATSLNDPAIGVFTISGLGGGRVPLRQLDSALGSDTCGVSPAVLGNANTPWTGEIHCDGRFLSQSLWDIRKARILHQGSVGAGQACADGLAFQTLLFFPESFDEYLRAMVKVDTLGLVPACAVGACGGVAQNCAHGDITASFAAHGLQPIGNTNDPYDTAATHNDAFETAVDVSSTPSISASIFPSGDIDFFTFPAGRGPVSVALNLPADPANPGLFKAYMLTLFDVDHRQLAQSVPNLDGINTVAGLCAEQDCTTTASRVVLNFNNSSPTQMFLQVAGSPTFDGGSNSGVNSLNPYGITFEFAPSGPVSGRIVAASFDHDAISFSVHVTTWVRTQEYNFASAQLRDQAGGVIPQTQTHVPIQAGDWLAFVSSANAFGQMTGTVQLQPNFGANHPALGTVSLEVFGYGIQGSTISFGQSQLFNLTTNQTELTAFNNIFSPNQGQKATIKYEIQSSGHVTLRLYTLNGTFITTLLDAEEPAGKGSVDWYGTNVAGKVVASGVYLLHLRAPGISKTQKIVVVK